MGFPTMLLRPTTTHSFPGGIDAALFQQASSRRPEYTEAYENPPSLYVSDVFGAESVYVLTAGYSGKDGRLV